MKEIFNILRHRGLQIKIMLRFYFTLVRVTTIKKTNNKGFREKENHCWGGHMIGLYTMEINLKNPHKIKKKYHKTQLYNF